MAIENKVLLNGKIEKIKYKQDKSIGEIVIIGIELLVMRRSKIAAGNRKGQNQYDVVLIRIRDKEHIQEFLEKHPAKGDMMQVYGVLCSVKNPRKYRCSVCGAENKYEGTLTYVYPLSLRIFEINSKRFEVIWLTKLERAGDKDEVIELLNRRKTIPGRIISVKDLGIGEDGFYKMQIIAQEETGEKEVIHWLEQNNEISNHVFIMGNLCFDPIYNPIENGGRVCSYQLGINRKVYIEEDDPGINADYPWIKSLGDQADSDKEALSEGSMVFIDGSIQARSDFVVKKVCENCGSERKVQGSAMEIIPYYVEYLRDCKLPPKEEPKEDVT